MKAPDVPVVAVLNMKGGVGKTTASAHISRVIFQIYKAATTLIDLDPQFNLTQSLLKRPKYDEMKANGKTIMAAMEPLPSSKLLEVRTSQQPPPMVSEVSEVLWHYRANPKIRLAIVPGDFDLCKYTLIDHGAKLKEVERRFLAFVEQAKTESDYICIDCNPSSSFLTLCVLKSATHILVPVRADKYSVLGLELLHRFMNEIPGIHPVPKLMVLMNDVIRHSKVAPVEIELRGHPTFGKMTLASKMYRSKYLAASPEYTGFASDRNGPHSAQIRSDLASLAREIGTSVGLKERVL